MNNGINYLTNDNTIYIKDNSDCMEVKCMKYYFERMYCTMKKYELNSKQKNIISEKYISDIDRITMDQDNKRLIIYTDTKGELVIDYDNDIDLKKDYEALKKLISDDIINIQDVYNEEEDLTTNELKEMFKELDILTKTLM